MFFVTVHGKCQRLCFSEVVFLYFAHFFLFFFPLSRLVFGLFGDMLRARLCQIEDRKIVKEKERRQIKLQCVTWCKE